MENINAITMNITQNFIEARERDIAGNTAFQEGHYYDAVVEFSKALELAPDMRLYKFKVAVICALCMQHDESYRLFEEIKGVEFIQTGESETERAYNLVIDKMIQTFVDYITNEEYHKYLTIQYYKDKEEISNLKYLKDEYKEDFYNLEKCVVSPTSRLIYAKALMGKYIMNNNSTETQVDMIDTHREVLETIISGMNHFGQYIETEKLRMIELEQKEWYLFQQMSLMVQELAQVKEKQFGDHDEHKVVGESSVQQIEERHKKQLSDYKEHNINYESLKSNVHDNDIILMHKIYARDDAQRLFKDIYAHLISWQQLLKANTGLVVTNGHSHVMVDLLCNTIRYGLSGSEVDSPINTDIAAAYANIHVQWSLQQSYELASSIMEEVILMLKANSAKVSFCGYLAARYTANALMQNRSLEFKDEYNDEILAIISDKNAEEALDSILNLHDESVLQMVNSAFKETDLLDKIRRIVEDAHVDVRDVQSIQQLIETQSLEIKFAVARYLVFQHYDKKYNEQIHGGNGNIQDNEVIIDELDRATLVEGSVELLHRDLELVGNLYKLQHNNDADVLEQSYCSKLS